MNFSIFHLFFILFISSFQTGLACSSNDLIALNGFSNCLASKIDGWNSITSDCCTWSGVTCDNSSVFSRRVVGLELGSKKLTGTNCESLEGLDQLRILNLSHNFLQGSLPVKLFSLQNLEVLDLSNNYFSGPVPVEGYMPAIRYLDMSNNRFSGSIETTLFENSPHIHTLNLARNHFNGEVSTSFRGCTSLQYLFLNGNNLSGSFPESVLQLQDLRVLNLQDNWFSGPLIDGIVNLSSLVELDVSSNRFSGNIPDIFGRLGKLQLFSANANNFSGHLPKSLVNSPSLRVLDLNNNTLEGPININCSAMIQLISLDLGSNHFHGPVPEIISSCQNLSILNLSRNKLGAIPCNFKNLQSLTHLSLAKTGLANISAALGILQHCNNLTTLILTDNFRDEQMPGDINLQFKNLKTLVIPNCQLRGSMPPWLKGCSSLQLLDLSWNHLTGSIPTWIGNFKGLFYLDLSNNSFTGEIPKSLTELQALVTKTYIPSEGISGFPLYKTRPGCSSSRDLQYKNIRSLRPTLDLSHNKLAGGIWPSFGNLKALHALLLNQNDLSGNIPDSLSKMSNLEILDLSYNKLCGEIPSSLVELSFLSMFSVAYNELCGKIPTGGQFLTFPDSSFVGNRGLGGRDLAPCQPVHYPSKHTEIVDSPFYIGAATSFVLTIILVFRSGWVFPDTERG